MCRPFGWGLSYTTFNLTVADTMRGGEVTTGMPPDYRALEYSLSVRNTGTRTGDQVVQVSGDRVVCGTVVRVPVCWTQGS